MGRKEDRRMKKLQGKQLTPSLKPFIQDGTLIIPVKDDSQMSGPAEMTPQEFERHTHEISDDELNRIIYQKAQMLVEQGLMPDLPEDDFGTVMWFTWTFITPEMREAFPIIAKEYLEHYKGEPIPSGQGKHGENNFHVSPDWSFTDIPYPRMNEATWDDAFYFRLLLMMLYSARAGSVYSKNFLLSLYKVYYKTEYNRVKRLTTLTYLDILEMHDEDCKRKGLPSGHTTNGNVSFKEMTIERRRHEPGWTNVYDGRSLSPEPEKKPDDEENGLASAVAKIRDISEAPDEPPLQPVASRLLTMCQLMGISIDPTCNEIAIQMNEIADSLSKLTFFKSPEYRKLRGEVIERCKGMLRVNYPEMFDPYNYQVDQKYLALQVAETVMQDVFKKYDTNVRLPYDSKKFDLPSLVADVTITLDMSFPAMKISIDEVLLLSMIQYLSECMCELMADRDNELDELLDFHRRRGNGEWEEEKSASSSPLTQKVIKAVGGLSSASVADVPQQVQEAEGVTDENTDLEKLKERLAQKEAALAESEQKTIQQRALYEREHEENIELRQQVDDLAVEHAELIALREFVYGLKQKDEPQELDEPTRDDIIAKIKDKKVTVLGGNERWIKRMRRMLPSWSFIGIDDGLGSMTAIERADFVYIYTSVLKHAQYYQAMNIIRRDDKMLFYLSSSNIDECLRQFEKELCREEF